MVKLIAGGQTFQVNEKLLGLTDFFKDLNEFENKNEDVKLATFNKQDVQRLFKACEIADYKFKQVSKVNQTDATAYIGAPLTKYFSELKYEQLNLLFKIAKHLKMKGLENNIAAYLAAKVWIKLNLQDYKKKKQQLKIKEQLTPQRSKELKLKYPFLN